MSFGADGTEVVDLRGFPPRASRKGSYPHPSHSNRYPPGGVRGFRTLALFGVLLRLLVLLSLSFRVVLFVRDGGAGIVCRLGSYADSARVGTQLRSRLSKQAHFH